MSGVLLVVLWSMMPPEVACLLAIGLANLIAVAFFSPQLHISPRNAAAAWKEYRQYLPLTRWSLLGAVSSELQTRTYLFLVEFFRGLAAAGTMHVGRLIVSPVMLLTMALGRIVLPRMAAHFHNDEPDKAFRIIVKCAVFITCVATAYGAVIYLAWPHLHGYLEQSGYPELAETVLAWTLYVIISCPGWCVNWLFRAMERLRELAIVSAINAAGVILLTGCLAFRVPLYSVLVIMIASELISLAALLWLLSERTRLRERVL
jgi:O-antigen/teichoic acid export membrane protein